MIGVPLAQYAGFGSPVQTSGPGLLIVKHLILTNAQLLTLDVTPVTIINAKPTKILVPVSWSIRTNKPGAAAWVASPALRMNFEGDVTALMIANFSTLLNTAAPVNTGSWANGVNTAAWNLATFNRIGKAIQVQFVAAPNQGGGSPATMDVTIAAYAMPMVL